MRKEIIKIKPDCSVHIMYYKTCEFRPLLFEIAFFSTPASRYLLKNDRIKTGPLIILVLVLYLFLDILYNFRIVTRSYGENNTNEILKAIESTSIFEHVIQNNSLRVLVIRLLIYSITRITISIAVTLLFYFTVSNYFLIIRFSEVKWKAQ